jgi:hypothetical protein
MAEQNRTVAFRLEPAAYNTLSDMLENSDYKRMSDLLRAIVTEACQDYIND